MAKPRVNLITEIAEGVMRDRIVDPSEYLTVPGNTIEGYVDGLIANEIDLYGMTEEEAGLLKHLLIEASKKAIGQAGG